MANEQFKIMIDPDVLRELHSCAERYGRKNANQVAAEILSQYLPLWKKAADAQFEVIRRQLDSVGQVSDAVRIESPYLQSTSHKSDVPVEAKTIKTKKRRN